MTAQSPRLTHLFLTGNDLAAMREFYVDRIGLAVLADEGEYLRLGGGGGADIGLEAAEVQQPPVLDINIQVANVDSVFESLSRHGVEFDGLPNDMPWGARHVWLRDPAGHRVSLYSK